MKLYATVTSERASKGQGGNKYINCSLTINEIEIAKMQIVEYPEGHKFIYSLPNCENGYINLPIIKGKKKKDENCTDCKKYGWCDAHAREAGE